MSSDNKAIHLGFIQGAINRMGSNSFLIKGWSVTLVVALFALATKDTNKTFILLAFFSALLFWWLDAFILHQEKLFRQLYEAVRTEKLPSDFSMSTTSISSQVPSIWHVMFSKTLQFFHGLIALLVVVALYTFQ